LQKPAEIADKELIRRLHGLEETRRRILSADKKGFTQITEKEDVLIFQGSLENPSRLLGPPIPRHSPNVPE
jgi:hypothetical protein